MISFLKRKDLVLYWLNRQNDSKSYELMTKIISNFTIDAQVLTELIKERHYQIIENLKQLNPDSEIINRSRNLIKLSIARLAYQEEKLQKRLNAKRK